MFGKQFVEIQNGSVGEDQIDITAEANKAMNMFKNWINTEPTHAIYKNWKKAEMKKKGITSFKRTPVK